MRKPRRETVDPDQPQHVTLRGNNRRRLFSYARDYQRFVFLLERAFARAPCQVHAATLMSNHVHLLVTTPTTEDLSQWVKFFAQRYAQWRNRNREASGKLFEERFNTEAIKSEEQLRNTTFYIDANATAAGLVDDPISYGWSTFPIHAGRPDLSRLPARIWTPSPWYLGLGRTAQERAERYREQFAEYLLADRRRRDAELAGNTLARIEALSAGYSRRLERPDRTRAEENEEPYGKCADRAKSPVKPEG